MLNEEIIRTMRKLNAMSRRGPEHRPGPLDGGAPDMPPPDARREHGRGRIMGILDAHGSMSQAKLAELLDIRPQSLSELICKMEADGLVARNRTEEDRRQTIVSLTEEGSARVAAFREAHRRHAEQFLSPLTDEEKTTLVALLRKLAERTGAESDTEHQEPAPAPSPEDRTREEEAEPAPHD